jgi:autotransporter-associated beta strand protein
VIIGSIEGDGVVFLGGRNLSVGTNHLDTNFAGVLMDGGVFGGTGGSLTKTGTGTLTLSGASTYTGGSIVGRGGLIINNVDGSGTGSGPVAVNRGTLGGTGKVVGAITIGSGSGDSDSILSPGRNGSPVGTFRTSRSLTFNSDATYRAQLNSDASRADAVVARGITINSSATIVLADLGSATLTTGTSFTLLSNTAATSIAGTFSSLADGSNVTIGSNTFQADYQGGDGNDLTLTVVP